MKTFLRLQIVFILFFLISWGQLSAAGDLVSSGNCDPDCYVDGADGDTSGDDSNVGNDWSSAFLTISKALTKADTSGDVIHVKSGVYDLSSDTLTISRDGITLRSDDGNGNLDPEHTILRSTANIIEFSNQNFSSSTTIEGFTIEVKSGSKGVYLYVYSSNYSSSPTIRGNTITTTEGSAGKNGIDVRVEYLSSADPIIENNKISGPFSVGINFSGSNDTIQTTPIIRGNQILAAATGLKVIFPVTTGSFIKPTIENNYISDSSTDGISITSNSADDTFSIKNNTLKSNGDNGIRFEFTRDRGASPVISHNLLKANGSNGFYYYIDTNSWTSTAPVFNTNSIIGNSGNGIYFHDNNSGNVMNGDLGGGGNSPGLNTLKNNGDGSNYYDLKNDSPSNISARYNWWASDSPSSGTEYIDIDGTTDASLALNNSLSFTLSATTGNESGGASITLTAASNTYFVDKVGSSDASTDGYRIEVKFGSNLATAVVVDPSNDSLTATIPAGTGTVAVSVTNSGGQTGTASKSYTYTSSNTAPTAAVLLYPADGSTDVSVQPSFAWKRSTDTDGDTVTYEVYVCENQDFSDCSANPVTMIWQQMITYAGLGGFAGLGLLLKWFIPVTSRRRRQKIKLILMGLLIFGLLLTACAKGDKGGDTPTENQTDDSIKTYTLGSNLKTGSKYYWKVIAKDEKGGETASEIWSFTTK